MRKVFLDELPHIKNNVNWKLSVGLLVSFIYDEVESEIKIIEYKYGKNPIISILYNGITSDMSISNFQKAQFGRILGKKSSDFKIEIGTTFKNDKRDITIINRKLIKDNNGRDLKSYQYKCNICNFDGNRHYSLKKQEYTDELWIRETNIKKQGCACCSSNIIVENINSIWHTDKWMIPIINDDEFCKTHTHGSKSEVYPTCSKCNRKHNKKVGVNTIYKQKSWNCSCSEGISYANKFMFKLLKQTKLYFEYEYSPDWIKPKRYDFYIPSMNLIIEMDGGIGHGNYNGFKKQSREDSKIADIYKDSIAEKHEIEVIRINCNYNLIEERFKYIENNIINQLKNIFNINSINWDECNEYACNSLIKSVALIKANNPAVSTSELVNIVGYRHSTIISWLKVANDLGWCEYNPKEEMRRSGYKSGKSLNKPILCLETNQKFNNSKECANDSIKLFKTEMKSTGISNACRKGISYKGFNFKYV